MKLIKTLVLKFKNDENELKQNFIYNILSCNILNIKTWFWLFPADCLNFNNKIVFIEIKTERDYI
jgi:hypothetical protein